MAEKYDKVALQQWAEKVAISYWNKARTIWGDKIGPVPAIEMNARLTATGGRAWINVKGKGKHTYEKIDLSCYLMVRNFETYQKEIIPHELSHFLAYRIYGDPNHGTGWKYTMSRLSGIAEPSRCHSMVTKSKARS